MKYRIQALLIMFYFRKKYKACWTNYNVEYISALVLAKQGVTLNDLANRA